MDAFIAFTVTKANVNTNKDGQIIATVFAKGEGRVIYK